jgi:simple sugar transport system ATP-binding protein
LGGGWIRVQRLRQQAHGILQRFGVKAPGPHASARSLSGGNLQKYIIGRELDAGPSLFVVSQPTWGVDIGAAAQIHSKILELRDSGCAVLLLSEDLEELFALCDRLHVIARGHLSPDLPVAEASVDVVGSWMSGLWQQETPKDAHATA